MNDKLLPELDKFKILSPYRDGIFGVKNINEVIKDNLKPKAYPYMILKNDYNLSVFNGDTGVVIGDTAYFKENNQIREIPTIMLLEGETSFATTVHKSQGSEFDSILLILSDEFENSDLLTKELLYTAITRARKKIEIWGSEKTIFDAVLNRTKRYSGLKQRLVKPEKFTEQLELF